MERAYVAEEWVKVADCADLEDYGVLGVSMQAGAEVCLYKLGNDYFATSNRCTHGNASLSDGLLLAGGLIECPLHEGTFNIRTGAPVAAPCTSAIRTYELKVQDGSIFLKP
jgi:nitrite reductase/ring-hydroxylating ferredoxin subunit